MPCLMIILLSGPVGGFADEDAFPLEGTYYEARDYARSRLADARGGTDFPDDDSLALQAEWQRVRREAFAKGRPSAEGGREIGVHARRLMGFIEGRLGIEVPEWWERHFRRGRVVERRGPNVEPQDVSNGLGGWSRFLRPRLRTLWARSNGWRLSGFDEVRVDGDEMTLLVGDQQLVLKKSAFEEFEEFDRNIAEWEPGEGSAIAGTMDESMAFVVFHLSPWGPTAIGHVYAIDRASGDVLWRKSFDGGAPPIGWTGASDSGSYSQLAIHGEHLVLFGGHTMAMHLNVFRRTDGKRLVRFATSYVDDKLIRIGQ